jgi:predicted ATPase
MTITATGDQTRRSPEHPVRATSKHSPIGVASAGSSGGNHIGTPDQRVRVFVSSTLQELAPERVAAQAAIAGLHLTPIMFELGARSHPPRELYRAYLAQSEVFVGIYWQQYGWVAPNEPTSGLEDEYSLCGDKPKLMYVKQAPAGREPRLTDLLDRITRDDGASYKQFETAGDLAVLLADDLAVLLTERFIRSVEQPVSIQDEPPLPVPPTALIDRQRETALVGDLVRDPAVRLVTLIGPGGIGKTRVALEVARRWAEAPPGGEGSTWFVDLAPVRDPSVWVESVANAVGIHPEGVRPVLEPIIDRLQGRTALIVLDNFEQVLDGAMELGRFLAACPDLTVLVTSRSALHLRGEREVVLPPLAAPPPGAVALDLVGRSPAVQLLVARAVAVRPGFRLTAANAAAVGELARRLEGMPLALELAAVQLRILAPSALLDRLGARLDRVLDLAAGPVDLPIRQQTLRATIEWSYELLDESSRALLDRLSVFKGAWTLAACEAVGSLAGEQDAVDTLASLVAQSLVRLDESDPDEPRFRMLDVVRAYAAERLTERGEVDTTVARLAHYLIDVVRAVRDDLQGSAHRAAAERLDRERDEIRSAIDWAITVDDAETVGWLLTPLLTYWWSRGLLPKIHDLADRAAALPSAAHLAPYASALLLGAQGMGMAVVGRTVDAEPILESTLEIATNLGNARLKAYAMLGLGWVLEDRNPGHAARRLDEAVMAFHGTGDWWGVTMALCNRGQLALIAGDHAAARTMHEQALAAAETVDNDYLRAQVLDTLGLDALTVGDVTGARDRYRAAADLHVRLLDYEGSAYCLSGLAGVALDQNRPEVAARLIAASDYARHIVGAAIWPGMGFINKSRHDAVRAALTPSSSATAGAEGARLRIPDALGYAVAATKDDAVTDPFPSWATRLRPALTAVSVVHTAQAIDSLSQTRTRSRNAPSGYRDLDPLADGVSGFGQV